MLLVLGAAAVATAGCHGRTTTSRLGLSWAALWVRAGPLVLPATPPPPSTPTAGRSREPAAPLLHRREEGEGGPRAEIEASPGG